MTAAVEIVGVGMRFDDVVALDAVDLAVHEHEFVSLLGASGCGKTTLLRIVAGFEAPTSGRVMIRGEDVTAMPPHRRPTNIVFQRGALFPHMNVFDNVAFALGVRKVSREHTERRVREALGLVRLDGMEARRPSELSGGQQQRVALARAIVFKPDILLLDEPLGALDRKLREQLQVELKQLQRTLEVTTILVTHDQEEALSLSDRLVVLDGGRVQQVGSPEEAYLRPVNRFVADFLGIANFVPSRAGGEGVVRPERIRVTGDGAEGFAGVVSEAVYLGQFIRYHVALENGRPIVAVVPFGGERFGAGARVRVAWKADDVWPVG